ncbi:VC0807 family protein [Streptomyces sp. NPDC017638]|uniref:VC0807 family protein n=1 Tax=Streptomyces sp. NPDC017638 TaxID=3365004 RepID=UPI0037986CE4
MTKTTGNQDRQPGAADHVKPLLIDIAAPLGAYYLCKDGLGTSTLTALALSSVVPAVRTVSGVVRERRINALAVLILAVNVVSLALSLVSGDPRLMLAKDGAVSSTVAVGILLSVALGRPMMSTVVKPFLVKNDPAREAAWARLVSGAAAGSERFRRKERLFSLLWGGGLLLECAARVAGAYTLPVETMVWLGTVVVVVVLTAAFLVSGGLAAEPMERLITAEAESAVAVTRPTEAEQNSSLAGSTHR